jgi:hypothetical protein
VLCCAVSSTKCIITMYEPMHVPTVPVKTLKSSQQRRQQLKKRTVKFLSVCRDPKVVSSVIRSAPDSVIKTICNAALNVQRGGRVSLGNAEKVLFRKQSGRIAKLVSKKVSIAQKRKLLSQRGGAFWIPALIGAALGGLGSTLFGGNKS